MLENRNKLMVGKSIVSGLTNIDKEKMVAAEEVAIEIISKALPSIDVSSADNLNLVIRPMALTIILNEMILENMFSETTLEGIAYSKTIPVDIKKNMLSSFAALNNIQIVRGTVEDMYSQINFLVSNKTSTIVSLLESDISKDVKTLLLLDNNAPEMTRNKISYIQLDSSKAMTFSRSNYEAGTLLDGGYNRNDRLRRDAYDKAAKIAIPGMIDILFATEIKSDTIEVERDTDGFYNLPMGYYIDIKSQTKDVSVSSVDGFANGMIRFEPKVFIDNGLETEQIDVTTFFDPKYYENIDREKVEVRDIEFMAKNPLFIDMTFYSRDTYPVETLLQYANEYVDTVHGDIRKISISDMTEYIFEKGINITIGARNTGEMFFSPTISKNQNIAFPLTLKDISIPNEIDSSRISERTVTCQIRSINLKVD